MSRARKKQKRLPRERRRETLLAAARTIVMERGYGELSMGRVAAVVPGVADVETPWELPRDPE